jgi:hypothetical protein
MAAVAAWVLLYDGGKQSLDLNSTDLDLGSVFYFLKLIFRVDPLKESTP